MATALKLAVDNVTAAAGYESIALLLHNEILAANRAGRKMNAIATDAGVCYGTVKRLFYRETQYPRFNTIMKLLDVFGYELVARKR